MKNFPYLSLRFIILFAFLFQFGCASAGIKNAYREDVLFSIDELKGGSIRLACQLSCSGKYGSMRHQLKKLHDNALWLDLAREISNVGYEIDQAYYYLGRSAEGMGFYSAARIYYSMAMIAPKCGGFINVCDGFVFPDDIENRQLKTYVEEQAAAERAAAEKVAAEMAAAEKAAAERAAAEKVAAEMAAAEKAATERAATERAATERAAAEKVAAVERAILEDSISEKAIASGYINVIGLVPGVSTQEQVERAKAEYGYVIGGYRLTCSPEYINKKLSYFMCVTGEDYVSIDLVSDKNLIASNIEIHDTLVKGFSEKLGKPKLTEIPTRTKIGVEYVSKMALWRDKNGNELTLISMTTDINTGALILKSAERIIIDKQTEDKIFRARNF